MNRLEKEMAYVEKEQVDRLETLKDGKGLLAIWLLHRLRTFRKMGMEDKVILQDLEYECRKMLP